VHQVGHYPELHQDARSTKHRKRYNSLAALDMLQYINCLYIPLIYVRGVEVEIHLFLSSSIDGGEWLPSRPCRITLGKYPRVPAEQEAARAPGPVSML
jgi:hypothetical protein